MPSPPSSLSSSVLGHVHPSTSIPSHVAQNFDLVLVVMVKLAGDTTVAICCPDSLLHILKHPRSTYTNTGCGWDGVGWAGMGGDGWA